MIMELMTQVVVSFGYFISCSANSVEMALGLGPPLLIPLMLFGGLFLNNGSVPVYFIWLKYISWFYYANEALCVNQWSGIQGVTSACPTNPDQYCNVTGRDILDTLNFNEDNFVLDVIMLIVLAVAFRTLAFLALLVKTW